MSTVQGDHMEVCSVLLAAGASVDVPNKYGYTAVDTATLLHRDIQ